MGLIVGTGIDDRDLALAHNVTHRAGKGEGARIVAENPPHAGTDDLGHAGLQRKIAVERDVVVVGHVWCLAVNAGTTCSTHAVVIPRESEGFA